jgi:hypothetical protein
MGFAARAAALYQRPAPRKTGERREREGGEIVSNDEREPALIEYVTPSPGIFASAPIRAPRR